MVNNKNENALKFRVNFQIKANYVNLIDENGNMIGRFSRNEAIDFAKNKGLDLVEVNSRTNPITAKLCDYNKFLYEQKKKAKSLKKNVQKIHNIQIHLNIEDNDKNHKFRQIRDFLNDNDLVKFSIVLIGREISQRKSYAFEFMKQCIDELSDIAQPDNSPKMNGKMIDVILKKKVI